MDNVKDTFEKFFENRKEFSTLNFSTERIKNALNNVGFDEERLGKIVHIAGTNGKGSTSYFIAQMLDRFGFKTALYTSPHIKNITERIKLNLIDIDEKSFYLEFSGLKDIILKNNLTFFEGLTLIALKIFSEYLPDYTILETGMGGRLDATNVVERKLPVITSISQDHTTFLGSNIFDILWEKLSIIKDNDTFFVGHNKNFIYKKIAEMLPDKRMKLVDLTEIEKISDIYPKPYSYNYLLARDVSKYLLGREIPLYRDLKLPPCRIEKIGRFWLDGSHNPSGIINTMGIFNADTIIFSSTQERPLLKMIAILKTKFKNIIITEIPENERTISIDNIGSIDGVIKIKDPFEAINKSIDISNKSDIVVMGSFYLCAYLREFLKRFCE
ncbi:MAG: hypothetical protein LDL13_03300 [Calditerrivibrio sp.]|nr:hypothetical protein [Calditerrivibrio sp.]MCA1932587.1 hypothetical protein [Calditerrivibrio sp.]MCA1980012.1 hypothetical protein [Calditerrivibrio sp.]